MDKITVIIPCYNGMPYVKTAIELILRQKYDDYELILSDQYSKDGTFEYFEFLLIDNSSTDKTLKLLKDLNKKDKHYRFISFSRNFGKDASMYAGLKASTGDYVAIMDADLQDPPELLKEMYKTIKTGEYDSVATYRKNRKHEPFFRSLFAKIFYKLNNKISNYEIVNGARDFRMMTRQMVEAVISLEEKERFTKGIFSWVGFKTKWIAFDNKKRVAGKTKLPMKSAFNYAIRGITSFSTIPLKIASIMGIIFCFLAGVYLIYTIINHFTSNNI